MTSKETAAAEIGLETKVEISKYAANYFLGMKENESSVVQAIMDAAYHWYQKGASLQPKEADKDMRWVRAAFPPKKDKEVFVRFSINKDMKDTAYYEDGQWRWAATDKVIEPAFLHTLEWLDESLDSTPNTQAYEDVRDYEASDKATSEVPCDAPLKDNNSIEQLGKDLLVYTVVADAEDYIRLSALFYQNKGYQMPTLEVFKNGESTIIADNEDWISDTFYNAVKRFNRRELKDGDREILNEFTKHINIVYDQIETLKNVEKVIEYSMATKVLNIEQTPERSVATKLNSSSDADNHNSQPTPKEEDVEKMAEEQTEILKWGKFEGGIAEHTAIKKAFIAGYNAAKTTK
jgi:hypothetical protein